MDSLKHILIIGSVVALICGVSAAADWPQFQGNAQHIGYSPHEEISVPLRLNWSLRLTEKDTPLSAVTIAEDKVLVTPWKIYLDLTDDNGIIWCLDSKDGTMLWLRDYGVSHAIMQPSYAFGRVYVQADPYYQWATVSALNLASGDIIWQTTYSTQGEQSLAPTIYCDRVLICGALFFGLQSFDAHTGDWQWLSHRSFYNWTPAAWGNHAYTYIRSLLQVVTLDSGIIVWEQDFDSDLSKEDGGKANFGPGNSPVIDTVLGFLYLIENEAIICLNISTRQIIWERRGGYYRVTPALYDGNLYALHDSALTVFDGLTGDSLWTFTCQEGFTAFYPPVIANGYVFVSSPERVYAVDLQTHNGVWNYPVGGYISVGGGQLYVSTHTGTLYAFGDEALGVEDESPTTPVTPYLHQNYPNPFNPSTVIEFELTRRDHAELVVYNVLGERVRVLIDGVLSRGPHSVSWDGCDMNCNDLASGVYFYRLSVDGVGRSRKMLLLK